MTTKIQDRVDSPLAKRGRRKRWAVGTALAFGIIGTLGGVAAAEAGGGSSSTSAQLHSYYASHHASVVQSLENPKATRSVLPTFGAQSAVPCDKSNLGLDKSEFTAPTLTTTFRDVVPTSQGQVWQPNGDVYTVIGGEQTNSADGSKKAVVIEMRVNQCAQGRDLVETLYTAPTNISGINLVKSNGLTVSFTGDNGVSGTFNLITHAFSLLR